jgi:hypothetical protein
MSTQEPHHLAAHLQARHVPVEIQPVQALDIKLHMAGQQIVHVDQGRHLNLPQRGTARTATTSRPTRRNIQRRRKSGLAVRGLPRQNAG